MKWASPFPRQILATLTISLAVGVYPLAHYGSHEIATAVIASAILGTLNVMLGYATIEYAFNKSLKTFTNIILGGMGIRLLLLLAAMLFFITVVRMHVATLTASLFYFYSVYLALEILSIQKKVLAKTSNDTRSHN